MVMKIYPLFFILSKALFISLNELRAGSFSGSEDASTFASKPIAYCL
jgi:hypothetical protein